MRSGLSSDPAVQSELMADLRSLTLGYGYNRINLYTSGRVTSEDIRGPEVRLKTRPASMSTSLCDNSYSPTIQAVAQSILQSPKAKKIRLVRGKTQRPERIHEVNTIVASRCSYTALVLDTDESLPPQGRTRQTVFTKVLATSPRYGTPKSLPTAAVIALRSASRSTSAPRCHLTFRAEHFQLYTGDVEPLLEDPSAAPFALAVRTGSVVCVVSDDHQGTASHSALLSASDSPRLSAFELHQPHDLSASSRAAILAQRPASNHAFDGGLSRSMPPGLEVIGIAIDLRSKSMFCTDLHRCGIAEQGTSSGPRLS